jgi:plasmid maintenance system killer protein
MTGWDVLDTLIKIFPPLVATLLLIAAGVIFIIGFSRHGINFLKYGFKQTVINDLLEKLATKEDISKIDAKFDARFAKIDTRIAEIDTRIAAIETNHFGHLKDFLTELTSILLDKNVINNQDKARLDNKLRGM